MIVLKGGSYWQFLLRLRVQNSTGSQQGPIVNKKRRPSQRYKSLAGFAICRCAARYIFDAICLRAWGNLYHIAKRALREEYPYKFFRWLSKKSPPDSSDGDFCIIIARSRLRRWRLRRGGRGICQYLPKQSHRTAPAPCPHCFRCLQ